MPTGHPDCHRRPPARTGSAAPGQPWPTGQSDRAKSAAHGRGQPAVKSRLGGAYMTVPAVPEAIGGQDSAALPALSCGPEEGFAGADEHDTRCSEPPPVLDWTAPVLDFLCSGRSFCPLPFALCPLPFALQAGNSGRAIKKARAPKETDLFDTRVARPAGFEPTTPWFVAKYSIQLSYGRVEKVIIT